ncbi:single-stranded DNA-binding protein, partial [Candidatus Parcubacteria bacterium]|nr:single-stranded DNA-binding protein [Candidatus Parcubacteria bacterium]
MNLNKVYLIGRLTQDPESRSTTSGQNVTTIKLATNRVWNDASTGRKEATEYHTIIAWGRLGEIANNYLKKGGLVMIEGRLQTRNWTGQDSVKRYVTEIIAEGLQMGPRAAGASYGDSSAEVKRPTPP